MYKRITLRIISTLADDLNMIAKKRGLSFNSLISEMAWNFVENWKEKYENKKYFDASNSMEMDRRK